MFYLKNPLFCIFTNPSFVSKLMKLFCKRYSISTLSKELNKKIVASGYAKIRPDRSYLKHANQAYLGFMFVPKSNRGNGYNKLIMDVLLKWCKEQKVFEIRLDVYDANNSAIKAYEKVGFKKHMINMRLNIGNLDY